MRVLIWNMGKVGSNSIMAAIRSKPGFETVHLHDVTRLEKRKFISRFGYPPVLSKRNNEVLEWIDCSEPMKIITLSREAISKNISQFFQDMDSRFGAEIKEFSLDELRNQFLAMKKHQMPLRWYDANIKELLGIDVVASSFGDEEYSIHKAGQIDILSLRSEASDSEKSNAVSDLLGETVDVARDKNVTADKTYSAIYREFKRNAKLPEEYIKEIYTSNYMQRMYPNITVSDALSRWA